jgi:hypothetical protein
MNNVVRAEPKDFVVTINDIPYPSGAWKFWIRPGSNSVTVMRGDKELCKTTLEATESRPAVINFGGISGPIGKGQ